MLPPEPTAVTDGTVTLSKVSPRFGINVGGGLLAIYGESFPENVNVMIGDKYARITTQSIDSLIVEVPSNLIGTVDVVLIWGGHELRLVNAYTYTDESGTTTAGSPAAAVSVADAVSGAASGEVGAGDVAGTVGDAVGTASDAGAVTDAVGAAGATVEVGDTGAEAPAVAIDTDAVTDPVHDVVASVSARPRLQLSATTRSFFAGHLRRVTGGSPVPQAPDTWASLSCRAARCDTLLVD